MIHSHLKDALIEKVKKPIFRFDNGVYLFKGA